MTDTPHPVLEIEMVPRTCFFSNLRSNLRAKDWKKLRQWSIDQAGNRCQICGSTNFGRGLECHEIWHYDEEESIQKLLGLTALCRECHRSKHLALAREMGWEEAARRHLMRVNHWNSREVETHIVNAFLLFETRSQRNWKLDISWLKGMDIEIPDILDRDQR